VPQPGPSCPHYLTKPSGIQPLVYLPMEKTLIQQPNLPWLPGQVGFASDQPQDGKLHAAPMPDVVDEGLQHFDIFGGYLATNFHDTPVASHHCRKRANQTAHWANKVIPKLILPYMEYIHQNTLSLQPTRCFTAHLHVSRGWLIFADCCRVFFRYVANNYDYATLLMSVIQYLNL